MALLLQSLVNGMNMFINIEKLDSEIKKVCPIHGVDSEGKISFKDEATVSEKEAAANVVANFNDVPTPPSNPTKEQLMAQLTALSAQIQALE